MSRLRSEHDIVDLLDYMEALDFYDEDPGD